MAGLPTGSSAAVFSFDDQSRLVLPATRDVDEVRKAISSLHAAGQYTAMHDAVFDASRYLSQSPAARRAIVLITDGRDENSALTLEDGVRLAQTHHIPVFAVGVGRVEDRVLRRIAKLTDGDYVTGRSVTAATLVERIGSLPVVVAPAQQPAAASPAPVSPAPSPSGAVAPRPVPGSSPQPVQEPVGSRRLVLMVVALVLVAAAVALLALRRAPAQAACPTCGAPLASPLASCPKCSRPAAPPTAPPDSQRPLESDLSPTVVERSNLTEEYLEKTVTLRQRPVLAITRGPGTGQVFELSHATATSIGRSKANDIVVGDVSVSSQHCRIRPEDGQFVLHDLKSTNGTLVNDKRVTRQPLGEGDVIKIGETSLTFRVDHRRT